MINKNQSEEPTGHEFSFEIRNIYDWYSKLQREYKRMLEAENATDHAINFAFTAHHLHSDWSGKELYVNQKKTKDQSIINKRELVKLNERRLKTEFAIIRDICEGSKHSGRDKGPDSVVVQSFENDGTFDYTFDFTFDKPELPVVTKDGERHDFYEIAEKVLNFWNEYFNQNQSTDHEDQKNTGGN